MAKTRGGRERQRRRRSSSSDLAEAVAVFGRAQDLYPKLQSQRDEVFAELQRLDGILAKLRHIAHASTGRPRAGGPTVADIVLSVLSSASAPMNAASIAAGVTAQRPVSMGTLQIVLRRLRDNGRLKASGKAKRFTYSLTRSGEKGAS
jgi:hypothetical protein